MIREFAKRLPFARRAAKLARGALRALPRADRPTILMYHRIAKDSFDPWALLVAPDNFAEHLRWLAAHRSVLALTEFAERHRNGSLPRDAIALTFDDGYACAAEVAAPLLSSFGLPATIFLPVELIERGDPFWWDELQDVVLGHDGNSLRLGGEPISLPPRDRRDAQWEPWARPSTARQQIYQRLWEMLRSKPPAELRTCMMELRDQVPHPLSAPALRRPMTPREVRAIASDCIQFGSHALTHPSLPRLNSSEKAREIQESVVRCWALSGQRPRSFAYPFGDFDAESLALVEKAGFELACATEERSVPAGQSVFALPRLGVGNWTAARLERALSRCD